MTMNMGRVIVGTDTDSVEDASQVILADVPHELDTDDVPQWVVDHPEHVHLDLGPLAGFDADQLRLLGYVIDMLRHGIAPRIINVGPHTVREAAEYHEELADTPLASPDDTEEQWALAKQADEELDNNHHFLDGVTEDMIAAVELLLPLDM